MPRPRPTLIVLAAAAGLVALAAVVLFAVVRLPWFERQAGQRLSTAIGWPVQLGGLTITYTPSLRVEAEYVVLPAGTQPGAAPLLEIAGLSVTLPWAAVTGGDLRLARLSLQQPRLHLAQDADGRRNWDALLEQLAARGGEGPTSFSVDELQVMDGSVDYAGAGQGDWRLAGIQLAARNVRPAAPFETELRLGGEGAGRTFHLSMAGRVMLDPDRQVYAGDELTLDGWIGGGDLPLAGVEWDGTVESLHADLAAGRTTLRGLQARSMGVELTGQGEIVLRQAGSEATFAFQTHPFSPRKVGVALGQPLPDTSDPSALTRAVLGIAGRRDDTGLALARLDGGLDDSRFSGEAMLPSGDTPPRLRLVLDRLDLDRYMPPSAAKPAPDGTLQASVETLSESLQQLDLDAEVQIGEVRAAGVLARGLTVRLEPMDPRAAP